MLAPVVAATAELSLGSGKSFVFQYHRSTTAAATLRAAVQTFLACWHHAGTMRREAWTPMRVVPFYRLLILCQLVEFQGTRQAKGAGFLFEPRGIRGRSETDAADSPVRWKACSRQRSPLGAQTSFGCPSKVAKWRHANREPRVEVMLVRLSTTLARASSSTLGRSPDEQRWNEICSWPGCNR